MNTFHCPIVRSPRSLLCALLFAILVLLQISASRSQRGLSGRQQCFFKTHPPLEPRHCDPLARYRTISGRCNNLQNREWGSAGSTLSRILPPAYEDGRSIPRGGREPSSLPNPRWISQKNHPDSDIPDSRFTHMVMQFGQFLDHDITLAPKDEEINCCNTGVQGTDCFTIPIPNQDRFYSWINSSAHCLNFVRSTPVCREKVRQQYNSLTAFVDASQVYGSDQEHAALLRTYVDGRLHHNSNNDQLPKMEQLNMRPNRNLQRPQRHDDFVAGDSRVNEQPFLTAMHLMFLREHNRIAKLLKEYLPISLQTDEILYQEARRLVGAEMQNIMYGEYLPTILGLEYMQKYNLIVTGSSEYDPAVNPSIFNSFSTSAFRFGHSLINGMFKLISQRKSNLDSSASQGISGTTAKGVFWLWRLREVFDGQSIRGTEIPIDNMIEGLITQEPQTCDPFFTTEITDHLFQKNHRRENFGEDLLAINIQRGREHGLPSYNEFRKWCGLQPLTSWDRRPKEHGEEYWQKLGEIYEKVEDVDIYPGAIGEIAVRGGIVGPTFACLIGTQFSRLKKGDRFFYTHSNGNGLGPVAKDQVLRRTMADLICDVTQLSQVQKWVTLQPNEDYNDFKSCGLGSTHLDVRAIAKEVAQELSASGGKIGSTKFPERVRSTLSRSLSDSKGRPKDQGEASKENRDGVKVFRFGPNDAITLPPSNLEPPAKEGQETLKAQPSKFLPVRFPDEEFFSSSERAAIFNLEELQREAVDSFVLKKSENLFSAEGDVEFLSRVNATPVIASHACLFGLCN